MRPEEVYFNNNQVAPSAQEGKRGGSGRGNC